MKITDFNKLLNMDSVEEPQAPAVLSGRELQDLLNPMSCEEFTNSYFSRLSLNLKGNATKFDHIFSWKRLREALARGQRIIDKRYNITASFTSGEEHGSTRRMFEAQHNQVSELLNAGATICITNIHMADPHLARWAQSIRAQLNFGGAVGVNCYISPDGSGLPMHYDKRVATTLQISGKKRWRFSTEAAKPWPNTNEVYQQGHTQPVGSDIGKLPPNMEFREVELNPGDLLCLPAGAWHSARGVGTSLALNLYFSPRNFLEQLAPLLQEFAASNDNWRSGPPAVAEKVQGDMPATISAYMLERLQEFQKLAMEILNNPGMLTEPWLNSLTNTPYTGWQPAPLIPIPSVTPDQRFRVTASTLRFIETQNRVIVPSDVAILKFPSALTPLFRRLSANSATFTIPEVLSWQQCIDGISPDEVMIHLKTLYKYGFLEMV